ncbi:MAG: hypothetical protein KME46_01550, partial [Brasilonema angustatum HA4187-MV1]|nr:hypothetical protein [Brasilonema angustatum HA4187-MV1]
FSSPFLTPPIRAKRHPVRHLGRVVEVLGLRYLSSFFGEGIAICINLSIILSRKAILILT